ncbi:MAG: hypothetical protein ABSH47_16805 [Bryobacteraceae bacterium]|jgi:hypothetical protein
MPITQSRHALVICLLAAVLVIGLLVVYIASYGPRLPPPPTADGIERVFATGDTRPAEAKAVTLDLDLYIDASMSMRGYLHDPGSMFARVLTFILEGTTASQYHVARYQFSTNIASVDSLPVHSFLSPEFYHGLDTPLSALLDRIARAPYSNHVSIIISDLVQSERGLDQLALVRSLQKLTAQNLELKLLAFRSNFHGPYYVEAYTSPGTPRSYELAMSQSLPGGGRPFYVLVIAPNSASLERLQQTVLDRAGPLETFSPTELPFKVSNIVFAPSRPVSSAWKLFSSPEQSASASSTTWYIGFAEVSKPEGKDFSMRLRYQVRRGRLPLDSLEKIRREIRRCSFDHGRFTMQSEANIPASVSGGQNSEFLDITYTAPRPRPGVWDIYRVRLRPGLGNVAVPHWVRDWSTDNDAYPGEGNKTFQLALLVEAMVKGITENTLVCEQYITFGRGE